MSWWTTQRAPDRRRWEGRRAAANLLAATLLLLSYDSAETAAADGGGEHAKGLADQAGPARWIDESGLYRAGFGRVSFEARDGNHLVAQVYRSTAFDPANGPIWFVMHGASRAADRYIRAAAPVAERHDALAIVIGFSKEAYPKGSDYTFGIERSDWLGTSPAGPARWRPPEDTLYAEVEHVFDAVRNSLGGKQLGYYLFGHSAGAQFTHRLLTFLPEPRVLGAVAANAGWYTLPTAEDSRLHSMPYGLNGSPVDPGELARFFEVPFVLLLGEMDTSTAADDELVRGTPEAEAQGATRLARGRHYFAVAGERASALNVKFAWRLEIVPRAGHDVAQMIDSAGFLTFVPGAEPCAATDANHATGLVITEILADPQDGTAGDANRDGTRDPAADEFIEIANHGSEPICLAGWTLGDAESPVRHVFPLGPALAPRQSLVVFGGGVPTGRFDGAQVQWTEGGLSLSNRGDVLTLRDAHGVIVRQVSWGDCATQPCAKDHWPGELEIDGSLTRPPEPAAAWQAHPEVAGFRYSPGFVMSAPELGR